MDPDRSVLADCLVRDYFRSYETIAGLAATARYAAIELREWYRLEVRPVNAASEHVAEDFVDMWYKTADGKLSALVRQPHFASWPGCSPVLGVRAGGTSVLVPGGGGSRRSSG